MAPIPQVTKKKLTRAQPQTVSTDNVVDDFGRTLTYLNRKQKSLDKKQSDNITINRQHAQQYESDLQKGKLIYRDVFPGRKYKLTLSDTTWIGGDNVVTIGYTVGNTFTQISYDQEDNVFTFEIPSVAAVDTMEIRLIGATDTVRSYLEDSTSASGILNKIAQILDDIIGLGNRIDALESAVGIPYSGTDSLDDRVTALENE